MKNGFSRALWMISGILMILAGILSFLFPSGTLLYISFILGFTMLASGFLDIAIYIQTCRTSSHASGWILADGILTSLLAIVLLCNQYITAVTLPFLFGMWVVVVGITRIINATELHRAGAQGWGWMMVHGVANIVFGLGCFVKPVAASIAIGILIGVSFLLQGVFALFMWWYTGHSNDRRRRPPTYRR